jgi:hypothetical protein
VQVDRISVTVNPELGRAVRAAAKHAGLTVSAWLSAAAEDRLRHDLMGSALDTWEQENGAFPEAELSAARAAIRP